MIQPDFFKVLIFLSYLILYQNKGIDAPPQKKKTKTKLSYNCS